MKKKSPSVSIARIACLSIGIAILCLLLPERGTADDQLDALMERTAKQVSSFLDVISETNCTERVLQEKLGDNGKIIQKEVSIFDYLIILTTPGGELNLSESRIVPENAKRDKKARAPLLVSNGFSTLFLVFHPYYSASFQFARDGEESINGRSVAKIRFQHIPGMSSPAALAVRGREYPLDIHGTAWIDPATGTIVRLTANIDSGMEDVGLRTMHSDVRYAPVSFHNSSETLWLPESAVIEVESRHEHWRNTHQFSGYKRFAVDTKEQVAKK